MLFKNKTLLKTFLFFTTLFFITPSFAVKKINFYHDWINNYCSADASTVCNNHWTKKVMTLSNASDYKYVSCQTSTYSANIIYNFVRYTYVDGKEVKGWGPDGALGGTNIGVDSITCQDNEKMELIGCTATCVPDQCASKVGQTFSKEVECGTATCPNGGVWRDNGSLMACDKGSALLLPSPNATTSQDQCSGTLNNPHNATGFKTKASFAGSSSARSYCTADYTYTGSLGSGTVDQTGLISMSFTGVTPTTENGQCPTGTVKGQFGSNGEWVCVPDTPTENNCPTGQIRDNQGNCVPTNEAGTCPTGQVKDASGNCVTPPPPQDTDGDGTPDDQDDTPNGDTGGGSGGSGGSGGTGGSDSGGSGSGSSGGSDSGGSSGAENGSGENASASQAQGCGTPPTCSGDPLQCASFIQDWKQNCQMMSVTQGDADKANALSAASKAEFTTAQTQQNQKVTGFFGDFKNTANSSLSSGQCPNDLNLSVMGKQMTLKFSESCFFWRLLRALVIASAYLAAASIVFRSLA